MIKKEKAKGEIGKKVIGIINIEKIIKNLAIMAARKTINNYLIIFGVAIFSLSCSSGVLVDNDVAYEQSYWPVNEKYVLNFDQLDTVSSYNFFITLRNTKDYPYRNIYVFLTTVFPNGNTTRDTIDCPLADYRGKWLGKGFGGVYDNRIIYMHNARFSQPGAYTITMEQAMRKEELPGIKSVGIRIEKAH
jgi:gliding motility-associated lipoprotein GldH